MNASLDLDLDLDLELCNTNDWHVLKKDGEDKKIIYSARENPPLSRLACRDHVLPFAWISWDPLLKELIVVRDSFGQIPLFYSFEVSLNEQGQKKIKFIFGDNLSRVINQLANKPRLTDRVVQECFTHQLGDCVPSYSNQTFFENVFRVRPSTWTFLDWTKGVILKEEIYWALSLTKPNIILGSDLEYQNKFEALLQEALDQLVLKAGKKNIAHEFSGGLDSSAILFAAKKLEIEKTWRFFSHRGESTETESEFLSVSHTVKKLGLENLHHWINGHEFDPLVTLEKAAKIFPGGTPYLFFPLVYEVLRAASSQGCRYLISGFGGDECISSHAGYLGYVAEMLKQKKYKILWQEYLASVRNKKLGLFGRIKYFLSLLQTLTPGLYKIFSHGRALKEKLFGRKKETVVRPPFFGSVRERDFSYLQGHRVHSVYMRIEYSYLAAQAFGLEYVYPFFYKPLLEFCFYLPGYMKRREGEGRFLVWRYFHKNNPNFQPDRRKMTGSILPGSFERCEAYMKSGEYEKYLKNKKSVYLNYITHDKSMKNSHIQTIEFVHAVMWTTWLCNSF